MEHLINQSIVFSPTGRTLSILNEEDLSLTLSNPSSRLLLELIKNNKNTVTRTYLMKNVWEDYGFSGSNNNLNGCVSEIRKAFEAIGIDSQILVTLPKVGFILDADVEFYTQPSNKDENHSTHCQLNNKETVRKTCAAPLNKGFLALALILTACGFLMFFIWLFMKDQSHEFKNSDAHHLYNYGQCNVFTLDPPGTYSKNELIKQANELLSHEAINCEKPIGDIFYSRMVNHHTSIQMTFIAICFPPHKGNYSNCQTIKNIDGIAP